MLSNSSSSKNLPRRDARLLWLSLLLLLTGIFLWLLNSSYFSKKSQEEISHCWQQNAYDVFRTCQNYVAGIYYSLTRSAISITPPKNTDIANVLPNSYPVIPSNTVAWQQTMQSIAALNKQIEENPNDPACRNRLGILYAQIGDFSAAAKQFNQAIGLCRQQIQVKTTQINNAQVNKSNVVKVTELGPIERSSLYVQLTCAHSNLARIYDKLGDHDRVIAQLQELNSDIAFAGDTPFVSTASQKTLGNINQSNKYSDRLSPAEASIFARAEALRQVGRLSEAQQEYTKLIKANPKLAIAHQRLGLVGVAQNNLWLAINELQNAAQLDAKDPDTENDLGLVYEQIGDYKAAQNAFSIAHKIDPKHLSASINLANLVANEGDCQSGINIMRKATIDHPYSATAHNNLAALIARTGNQTEAAKVFVKTIALDPSLPSAHYGLGLALLKLKSYPAAIKEFQTAMTLNPGILDLQNKIDLAYRCNLRSLAYTQMNVH